MSILLLVDTNILVYGLNPDYAADVAHVFSDLEVMGYKSTISAYTTYEIYRGLARSKVATTKNLISQFEKPIELDLQALKIAAALTTCYRTHSATKDMADRYKEGDVILAATAIYTGMHILTANGNDFPRPFFVERQSMDIKNSKKPVSINLQILAPDVRCFNNTVKDCYK